jgi:hypothetical protein
MTKRESKRILYLRTFREKRPDHLLVASLVLAVDGLGKLIVVGPKDGEISLRQYWSKAFGESVELDNRIEYVVCSDDQWRTTIHWEISKADCVLLYLSPKRNRFPKIRLPKIKKYDVSAYFSKPFLDSASGRGLLHEVAYLYRLGKLHRTIVLCASEDLAHIKRLIYLSSMTPLGSYAFSTTLKGPRPVTPRLIAADKQLARLEHAFGIIGFTRSQISSPARSDFLFTLRPLVVRVIHEPKHQKGARRTPWWRPSVLLGTSSEPRRLPPDNERKIIQFTNVEDLIDIPPYEITDVDFKEVLAILDETQRRCPSCKAPISSMFFYIRGLYGGARDLDAVKARCQECMVYLVLDDGVLRDPR